MAATALGVFAVSRKPGGSSSAESPCDIQTASILAVREKVASRDCWISTLACPYSRLAAGAHFSAERIDHELQSVADAEHRNAEVEDALVGQRRVLSYTDDGPPERMIPTGE